MLAKATSFVLAAALAAGCAFHRTPPAGGVDGGEGQSMVDAVAGDGSATDDGCLRDELITVCFIEPPSQPVALAGELDTVLGELCSKNVTGQAAGYCVVAGTSITVGPGVTVTVKGARPLVLASLDTIKIDGTIDLAGHLSGTPQPQGAGVAACGAGTAPTGNGGGFGGSFGSIGGAGGKDGGNGAGGVPPAFVAPTAFHAGCSGQPGPGNPGSVGGGGGAIALMARTSIELNGVINASGGGGSGAPGGNHGGSGGGAGGMIVIDAPVVSGGAPKIYANGGSGGEGAGGNAGNPGNDADADPTKAALGGGGNTSGGDGGAGAFMTGAAASAAGPGMLGTSGPAGGGGGGGGVGVIRRFKASALPGTVSPPAT